MSDIRAVLMKSLELLNVRLSFGSYSFTMLQFALAMFVLSVIVMVIRKLFE